MQNLQHCAVDSPLSALQMWGVLIWGAELHSPIEDAPRKARGMKFAANLAMPFYLPSMFSKDWT